MQLELYTMTQVNVVVFINEEADIQFVNDTILCMVNLMKEE
ncbi:hypothetical protein [Oceanobacillus jeddahense]